MRLDDFVKFRPGGVRDVNNVDPAGTQPRDDQVTPRKFRVAVTTAAGIPPEMMQFVPDIRHRQSVNDLAVIR